MNLLSSILNGASFVNVSPAGGVAGNSVSMTTPSENALNINNFADFIKAQQQLMGAAINGQPVATALPVTLSDIDFSQPLTESALADIRRLLGNSLPEDGETLPLTIDGETLSAEQLAAIQEQLALVQEQLNDGEETVSGVFLPTDFAVLSQLNFRGAPAAGVADGAAGATLVDSMANKIGPPVTDSNTGLPQKPTVPATDSIAANGQAAATGALLLDTMPRQWQNIIGNAMSSTITGDSIFKEAVKTELPANLAVTATTTSGATGELQRTSIPAAVAAQGAAIALGKPGWSEAITERVMWLSSQQASRAEIALDPPELGPLQVRITHHQDQTSIAFSSQHAVVRDALDQGMTRLREMLENQGINLANVDVSDQGAQRQGQYQGESGEAGTGDSLIAGAGDENASAVNVAGSMIRHTKIGLVDDYV